MRKLILLAIASCIVSITTGQTNIEVFLNGHKGNDTIAIDDLLRIQNLSVSNNDYMVVGFQLNIMDRGFLKEFRSSSDKITQEMINAVEALKNKNIKTSKIFFENIKVKMPEGNVKDIGGLLYIIKIE